ncbi:MAG: GNAT family N-acetyltransferase [Treponemataceae bacterium]|nr:GNAT family N-acetyltransferase [Treponemataceae bacterium]
MEDDASMIEQKNYTKEAYEKVCDFLITLNAEGKKHINWNWARFEWMYEHPEFDKSLEESIGLWWENGTVVAAAIYDMYFGEAFCGVLSGYELLYDEVLLYARTQLRDDGGLGIAIGDDDDKAIEIARSHGFEKVEQDENMLVCHLDGGLQYELPEGFRLCELDPAAEPETFSWLLWQGFDHGSDREEWSSSEESSFIQCRPHLKPELSLAVKNPEGTAVAYCCLWYDERTDYAYVEPVCTVPCFRGKGLAKAALYEAMNRAFSLGAKEAFVISDMDFYRHLGFTDHRHYTFYWKN